MAKADTEYTLPYQRRFKAAPRLHRISKDYPRVTRQPISLILIFFSSFFPQGGAAKFVLSRAAREPMKKVGTHVRMEGMNEPGAARIVQAELRDAEPAG